MSRIGNVGFVNQILKETGLSVKKKYGQNFLTDQNILKSIVDTAEVTKKDAVIEIGPGLGALTEHLCEQAGYVLAYEIDGEIIPTLEKNLHNYLNYKIIQKDILKANIEEDINLYLNTYENIYLVANLPYYITTPIILGLLSKDLPIKRYVMMMQLEVADRICGKPATKDYNALSIVIGYKALATKIMKVPRTVFIPSPNVDSAVVKLDLFEKMPFKAKDDEEFYKLVRTCFTQRRKTIYNNLCLAYDRKFVGEMLERLSINPSVRAEALSIEKFILLSDYITQNYK